jgi:hypothetical protein
MKGSPSTGLLFGSSGNCVGPDDGAISDHARLRPGQGVNPPAAASTRRAWRFVVVILAGSANRDPRSFADGGSGSYTHRIRQAAPIAPTIGGFSSLCSSEAPWPDTAEPPTLLRTCERPLRIYTWPSTARRPFPCTPAHSIPGRALFSNKSALVRLHAFPWRSVTDSVVHFGIIRRSAFSGIPGVPGD